MKNNNCVINTINVYQIILSKTMEYSKQEKKTSKQKIKKQNKTKGWKNEQTEKEEKKFNSLNVWRRKPTLFSKNMTCNSSYTLYIDTPRLVALLIYNMLSTIRHYSSIIYTMTPRWCLLDIKSIWNSDSVYLQKLINKQYITHLTPKAWFKCPWNSTSVFLNLKYTSCLKF